MPQRPASPIMPFAIAALGIAAFSAMDAFMKGLAIDLGAYNAMLWRVLTGAAFAGLLFFARREPMPARAGLRLHLLRGTLAPFMAITFFWGVVRVPLAEAIALSFIAPLITLYLAAVMLGEKISRHAIAASILGVIGVGVILAGRISGQSYDEEAMWGAGSILISAVLYAFNLILQRKQAQVASPMEIAFFQSLVAGCVLALASPVLGVVPSAQYWPDIIISALLMMAALLLLSWAYARAEAQVLVTVEYTAFIWAALLGWWFFREEVTLPTIIGTALIVTGCLIATRQKSTNHAEHIETAAL
jgi:S-adenosylmethionine uptake transporter